MDTLSDYKLTRSDWLLLILVAAHGDLLGSAQIQKAMFILWKEKPQSIGDIEYYSFVAGDYNAFSLFINRDIRALEDERFALVVHQSLYYCCATIRGQDRANELKQLIDPDLWDWMIRMMEWLIKLSFSELIRYMNNRYPDYAVNSVFSSVKSEQEQKQEQE